MSISLGQIILVVLVAGVAVYVFAVRSVSRDRTVMLLLAAVGLLLVAWPGLSTDVAHAVGIGRGVDLLLYLFVVFCLFRFIATSAEVRRVNDRITGIVRQSALASARPAPRRAGAAGQPETASSHAQKDDAPPAR